MLVERWVGWNFSKWKDLPAFTGRPDGVKQGAAWWVELPKQPDQPVRLRFRSLEGNTDFRRARKSIDRAEKVATSLWKAFSRDPIVELGQLQWFDSEAQQRIDNIATEQLELRRQRRTGDLNQRDFEADERDSFMRLEGWESMQATVRARWDELLEEMVAALPRPRRDELRGRIVMLADRLQSDSKQLQRWRDDHWDGTTLRWSA
ncbi:MAG: Uncharacterised protein [Synechococcus sp. MIT S9220]|nr:MAG: Uncharacterised protein [Synechococcus sp. MIT S9220]